MEWTTKYQPKNFNKYIGDKSNINIMMNFLDKWIENKPLKKCILLYGTPGNGKTSLLYSLEDIYNLNIIEVNASDHRNSSDIKRLSKKTSIQSMDDRVPILLMDEVDGLGAWKALEELIFYSLIPIVMTCNDIDVIQDSIIQDCITLQVDYPPNQYVITRLKNIVQNENKQCSESNLIKIANNCNSVRSAILTLQRCLINNSFKKIIPEDVDHSEFEQIRKLFSGEDVNINLTPEVIQKWAKKNNVNIFDLPKLIKIGREYPNMQDIIREYSKTLRKPNIEKLKSPYFKKIKKTKRFKKKEYKPKRVKREEKPVFKKEITLNPTFEDDDIW